MALIRNYLIIIIIIIEMMLLSENYLFELRKIYFVETKSHIAQVKKTNKILEKQIWSVFFSSLTKSFVSAKILSFESL